MPKYEVETTGGKFDIELDREPESQEQLMQLVSDHLAQNPQIQAKKISSYANELSQRSGFWGTMGQEASAGVQEMGNAIRMSLNPPSTSSALALEGPSRYALGALRVLGSPMEGLRQWMGEGAQDIGSEMLGMGPTSSAALGTAANIGALLMSPSGMVKGAERLAGRVRRSPLGPLTSEQRRVIELGQEFGVQPSAGQIRGTPGLAQMETFPERFPIGAKRIVQFGEKQRGEIRAAAEEIGKNISPESLTPSQAGNLIKERLFQENKARRATASKLYDERTNIIPEMATTEPVNTTVAVAKLTEEARLTRGVVTSKAHNIAEKLAPKETPNEFLYGGRSYSELRTINPDLADTLIEQYRLANPDTAYTFKGLDLILQDVRGKIRQAVKAGDDNLARRLGILEDGVATDRLALAERHGAGEIVQNADAVFKTEVAPFFTKGKFPRKISDQQASQIVKGAIWLNKDKPENIELLERAVNNPDTFNQLTRAWWDDLITKSVDPKTQLFSAARLMTNYSKFSPEVRAVLMKGNGDKADRLMELFSALQRSTVMNANPSQTARGLLSAGQVMGIINIAGKAAISAVNFQGRELATLGREGAVLLTPALVSKVLTSPKGIDWLTIGLQSAPGSQSGKIATTQILALANAAPKKEIADILRDAEIPLKDKIAAALGGQR